MEAMKTQELNAIYEGNGVLQLTGNLDVPKGEEVSVRLSYQPSEDEAWLEASSQETANRLVELERDVDPRELADWFEAMEQSSESAHYEVGKGIVIESK